MNKDKNTKNTTDQEVVDLVIARLETMPSNISMSIGGGDNMSIQELIERVRVNDEVGKQIVEMQLDYLRSLKDLPLEENVLAHN